jgi:serine/threonine protein kinase
MDHPNICRYLHIEDVEKDGPLGEKERTQVCVMELVPDGDFGSYYRERKDTELLRRMVTDILRGLAYLHSKGIVHRRLKASNLLVGETTQGPVVKITDFGLGSGKAALRDARLSSVVVEVTHMAPEQFNPRKYGMNGKLSYHLDFWLMGLAIYEALTNNDILFKNNPEDSREQVIQNILAPALPEKVKRLPAPFDRVVARCLAKHVDDRVQNTRELLELLAQPITVQDDVYDTVVLPAMAREEAEMEQETIEYTESVVRAMVARAVGKEAAGPSLTGAPLAGGSLTAGDSAVAAASVVGSAPLTRESILKAAVPGPAEPLGGSSAAASADSASAAAATSAASSSAAAPVAASSAGAPVATPLAAAASGVAPLATAVPSATTASAAALGVAPVAAETSRSEEVLVLFNRYEYYPRSGFIGKGGFSRVYKALDRKLDRWVALKLYKSGDFADRYSPFAEIRRVINLDHPNICRYLDIEEMEKENAFGEKEIMQTCVMELLDGGNLHEYYSAHPTEDVLKKLLTDVLKGLEYLHKNGIIHRDIKPANILIKQTYDGPVAKITDFGISKLSDSINQHSSSALVVSIPYMAPEQLSVKKYGIDEKISYNLDLWSLGVTVYEIITGNVLFKNSESETSEQIMTNIMAPELPEKINELPQPFLDIVRRCVVKDARERVQRAEELIELLHRPVMPVVTAVPVAVPVVADVPAVAAASVAVPPVAAVPVVAAVVEAPVVATKPVEVAAAAVPVAETPVAAAAVETKTVGTAAAVPVVETPVAAAIVETAPVATPIAAPVVTSPATAPVETAATEIVWPTWVEEKELEAVEPEEEYVPLSREERPRRWRAVAIVAAILLVGAGVFAYLQRDQVKAALGYSASKVDSTNIVSGASPASTGQAANPAVAPIDSTKMKASMAAAVPEATEKKPRHKKERVVANPDSTEADLAATEAGEDSTGKAKTSAAKPTGTSAGGTELTKYVLLLTTPTACSININNVPYGVLENGKTMKVYLSPGNYIIQATSTSNASAVYTGRLVVLEENLNQVGKYTIPL